MNIYCQEGIKDGDKEVICIWTTITLDILLFSSHTSSFVFQGSFRPAASSCTSGVSHDLQQMEWVCPLPGIHSQLH